MKRKGKWICLAAFLLLILAFPASVSAKVGSQNSKGAVIPKYKKVVVKNVEPAQFDRTLKNALEEAKEKASRSVQYKIVIPPGSYQAGRVYTIPSNTFVYAKGATINATGTRVTMLLTDLMKKSENIMIEGGTWTTLSQPSTVDGTVLRFMGVKNMVLKNMTIKTKRKSHIIEVADMNGFTVMGCKLSGNNKDAKEPYKNVQPKEAIQLDVATKEAMPGYAYAAGMYNGKGCHNVLIKNNTITNCARGVGSHSGTGGGAEKKPYTNITVTGNTMSNLLGEGIFGQDWRDCTISGNTISRNKQAGIYLHDAYNLRVNKNKIGLVSRYTGKRKATYDPKGAYGIGILMRRSSKIYMDYNIFNKLPKNPIVQEANCKGNTLKGNKSRNIIKR